MSIQHPNLFFSRYQADMIFLNSKYVFQILLYITSYKQVHSLHTKISHDERVWNDFVTHTVKCH